PFRMSMNSTEPMTLSRHPRRRSGERPDPWADPGFRLHALGPRALSDAEVVALTLDGGSAAATHRAAGALERVGGLKALVLSPPPPGDLSASRERTRLIAAVELGRRTLARGDERPRLTTPEAIYAHVRPHLAALRREVFHVLSLNARNVLLDDAR